MEPDILPENPQTEKKEDQWIFPVTSERIAFQQKGQTLSVINQKGGCGKTTTAINFAAGLVKLGFEVLLIDLDPQANASSGLGVRLEAQEKTVYDLFKNSNLPAAEAVYAAGVEHLWVIPGSSSLSSLAVEIMNLPNWEYTLRSFLKSLKGAYDFILIDCPPALNALTVNALTASDDLIIPIQTHYFSLQGMKELFSTLQNVRQKLNPLLKEGRILATLYDRRTRINREMLDSIREYFNERVFDTVIRCNIRLVEAVLHGQPIMMYDPKSIGARDYESMAEEFVKKLAAVPVH